MGINKDLLGIKLPKLSAGVGKGKREQQNGRKASRFSLTVCRLGGLNWYRLSSLTWNKAPLPRVVDFGGKVKRGLSRIKDDSLKTGTHQRRSVFLVNRAPTLGLFS